MISNPFQFVRYWIGQCISICLSPTPPHPLLSLSITTDRHKTVSLAFCWLFFALNSMNGRILNSSTTAFSSFTGMNSWWQQSGFLSPGDSRTERECLSKVRIFLQKKNEKDIFKLFSQLKTASTRWPFWYFARINRMHRTLKKPFPVCRTSWVNPTTDLSINESPFINIPFRLSSGFNLAK